MDETIADQNSTDQEDTRSVAFQPQSSPEQQAVVETTSDPLKDALENILTCAICREIMLDVNTVNTCGHIFCGFCIGTWLAGYNNRRCPTCREPALGAKYHPQLDQVAQAYIETHPELKMPEPEIAERREFYRPGSRVYLRPPFRHADHRLPAAEEEEAVVGEDDEMEEDDLAEHDMPLGIGNLTCPCCDPESEYDYVCPEPIPGTLMHQRCQRCMKVFPLNWKPYQCENCGLCTCATMFDCMPVQPEFGSEPFALTSLRDSRLHIGREPAVREHPIRRFKRNVFEQQSLSNWMAWKTYTWSDIREMVRQWAIDQGHPDMNKLVCNVCSSEKFESLLVDWWIAHKENPESGYHDARPKCWYGIECRTQSHRPGHAARYNHLCRRLPAAERRDAEPPVGIPPDQYAAGIPFPGGQQNEDPGN